MTVKLPEMPLGDGKIHEYIPLPGIHLPSYEKPGEVENGFVCKPEVIGSYPVGCIKEAKLLNDKYSYGTIDGKPALICGDPKHVILLNKIGQAPYIYNLHVFEVVLSGGGTERWLYNANGHYVWRLEGSETNPNILIDGWNESGQVFVAGEDIEV